MLPALGQGPRSLTPLGHHITGHGCVIVGRSPSRSELLSLRMGSGLGQEHSRNQQGLDSPAEPQGAARGRGVTVVRP